MATFILLANFTDQGIRNIKETISRAEAFKEMAKKSGITMSSTGRSAVATSSRLSTHRTMRARRRCR
jgi:hypothetical protein